MIICDFLLSFQFNDLVLKYMACETMGFCMLEHNEIIEE